MRKILIFAVGLGVMVLVAYSSIVHAIEYDEFGNPTSNTQVRPATEDSVTPARTEDRANPSSVPALQNPLKVGDNICEVLKEILKLVVRIGSLIAVLLIIWSGFLFIKAQGNPTKITDAKKTFMWTIIGTAILLGSSVIANIIVETVLSVTNLDGITICNI